MGYRTLSCLTIPLKNTYGRVLGVLQLINAQDPNTGQVPFDPNLQQMMESFSSLAVAALEAYIREQGLKQQIEKLRIEIDEVKRQKQVSEIVDTDFFRDLQAKARAMRGRKSSPNTKQINNSAAQLVFAIAADRHAPRLRPEYATPLAGGEKLQDRRE